MVRAWIKHAQVWFDKHSGDNNRKFTNAIDKFVCDLFYESDYNLLMEATNTLYGKTDWRKYLEDYFHINLSVIQYE